MAEPEVAIEHPNRSKAASKATRLVVVALLLASAFLLIVISVGAWDTLVGAKPLQVIYIVLYLGIAFLVLRWSRGVLPLAAALAIVLFIFALVSVPGWFERDKDGLHRPRDRVRRDRAADRDPRAAAGAARRLRDARLPAGLERRGGAPRGRRGGRARLAAAGGLSRARWW